MATLPFDSLLPTDEHDAAIHTPLRGSLLAVGALVFGLGGAAAFVPIGGAVVGSGQVGVASHVKRVAHPTGGIIARIMVRNGDHVRRGDVLMRLDDTVSGADARLSTLSVDQLIAQRARLEAERLGASSIAFPAALAQRSDAGARRAMGDEQRLFAIRRGEENGMRAQLAARIGQYREQIAGYRAEIAAMGRQAALIEPERQGVKTLWGKGLVTLARVNQLERTRVDMDGSIGSLRAQIAQTQARITETREQAIQLGETRRSDAGTQLSALNATLNQQQVRSVSAGDAQGRSVIRAPYDGVVDKLAFATVGDVVKPAETILEIVPDGDTLVVETTVSPTDIDQLRPGQPARIRFSAFNATSTPEIHGRVTVVAPERTTDPQSRLSFYAVRVEIDQAELAREGGMTLKPGMPAEVFVETGNRSMLSYLTKPLRDQLARAFRD